MLPPGMSFNALGDKALAAAKHSKLPKSFWAWDDMLTMNKVGFFPYTPATQMLHGLAASIDMLHEEGLDNVFARHDRLAEATRRAVRAWGLEIMCREPKYYSPTVTAVMMPEGHDGDAFRNLALDTFNISYGTSFGRYAAKYFRIGHLGDINDGYLDRRAGGDRDGACACRRAAQEGRRAGGDGLHRFRAREPGAGGGRVGRPQRSGPSSARWSFGMRLLCGALAVWLAVCVGGPAFAQSYPNRPLRIFVPFAPGGGVDALARLVGTKLSELVRQPVWSTIAPVPAAILAPTWSRNLRRMATPSC